MKSLIFIFAILFSFASFSAVDAKPQKGQANQKAIQKAVQKELAKQQGQNRAVNRNRGANRAAQERAFRQRELIDFNRRLIFRSAFVDPFGVRAFGVSPFVVNPFIGNRFFFQNRNFAIGF